MSPIEVLVDTLRIEGSRCPVCGSDHFRRMASRGAVVGHVAGSSMVFAGLAAASVLVLLFIGGFAHGDVRAATLVQLGVGVGLTLAAAFGGAALTAPYRTATTARCRRCATTWPAAHTPPAVAQNTRPSATIGVPPVGPVWTSWAGAVDQG